MKRMSYVTIKHASCSSTAFFCCVCVSPRNVASRNAACWDKVCPQESRVSFSIQGIVSAKSIQVPPRHRWVAPLIFFQETHVFFFMIFVPPLHPQKSLCFPWTSCFNFLVMKCDEWLRNVVHPIYTKELPHWDGLCHPFLRNAERADGKLGWNHPSRTQMPRSVMMWIWIYHDLFIYLPNCLFMRWFIELFIYIYPIIYLSTYLPT